jgi:hypothetical protein
MFLSDMDLDAVQSFSDVRVNALSLAGLKCLLSLPLPMMIKPYGSFLETFAVPAPRVSPCRA